MHKDAYLLKKADKENAAKIYSVMKEVYDRLEDRSLFVCDDLEFVERHIEEEGFSVIACDEEGKIIACSIFRYPMHCEDNLGRDIGLTKDQQGQVVHMESQVVLPEYRGNSLQSAMLRYGEELIDRTKYRYFMATVSPDNKWSCHSFEKNGYKVLLTKEKYNGLERRIYLKEV